MTKNGNNKFAEVNTQEFLETLRSEAKSAKVAFRRLVEITHGPLMYYIQRFVSNVEEAQEVVQEVFLAVHKGLDKFEGKSKLTTWVYGMAHNKVCDRLNDKAWQHEEFADFKAGNAIPATEIPMSRQSEWEMSPDRWFQLNQVRDRIPEIAKRLPNSLKEIYYLRDLQGMNSSEVAEALEISEEAVRVRLHRARNKIVEWVKESFRPEKIMEAGVDD